MNAAALGMLMAGAALLWWLRPRMAQAAAAEGDADYAVVWRAEDGDAGLSLPSAGMMPAASWTPPAAAAPYLSAIERAERVHGLPAGLLARLLYQESRYRADIIDGRSRSPAGAIGIAQFMPATAAEFGIDPRDPWASIDAAALYLSQLYRRFGNWSEALAAYNWGQGNVSRRGIDAAPAETRAYYSQIMADVGLA